MRILRSRILEICLRKLNQEPIYNWRPYAKNQFSRFEYMDVAAIWIMPIIWSQVCLIHFPPITFDAMASSTNTVCRVE